MIGNSATDGNPSTATEQERRVLLAALRSEAVRSALVKAQLGADAFAKHSNKLLVTAIHATPWGEHYPARVRLWLQEHGDSDDLFAWEDGLPYAIKRTQKAEKATVDEGVALVVVEKIAQSRKVAAAKAKLYDLASNGAASAELVTQLESVLATLQPAATAAPSEPEGEWSDDLEAADLPEQDWLVEGLLQRGANAILVGASKSCKTQLALELALRVATGKGGLWGVALQAAEPEVVIYFSGESGRRAIKYHQHAIRKAKGVKKAKLRIEYWVPQLHNERSLVRYQKAVKDSGAALVIIDCMYLTGIDGGGGENSANLNKMGPLLTRLEGVTRTAGAPNLVAVHHTSKGATPNARRAKEFQTLPEIVDVAYTGFENWCRQYVLTKRNRPYEHGQPDRLWLVVGGSADHPGYEAEVTLDRGDKGKWKLSTRPVDEARLAHKLEALEAKGKTGVAALAKQMKVEAMEGEILKALKKVGAEGLSRKGVADAVGVTHQNKTLAEALSGLAEEGKLIKHKPGGVVRYRLADEG
jgi:hypothetical protein